MPLFYAHEIIGEIGENYGEETDGMGFLVFKQTMEVALVKPPPTDPYLETET